jgi:hypothetical protein
MVQVDYLEIFSHLIYLIKAKLYPCILLLVSDSWRQRNLLQREVAVLDG